MSHSTRKKQPARYYLSQVIDQLEARALLSGSTATTHHVAALVHAQVAKSTVHAQQIDASMLKHAAQGYTPAAHVSTAASHASKVTAHVAKHSTAVKASTHTPALHLWQAIKSPLDIKKYQAGNSPVPGAFTPLQIETAYTVNALGLANQGQGQTIGIIDEYNDPNILADANAFSNFYKLPTFNTPGGPTMTVVSDSALGKVTSAAGTGVGVETSLDVEWAHAMAPKANILMIFVPAAANLDLAFAQLLHGVQLAASMGASVVSLSYGFFETNLIGDPTPYPNQQFIDLPAEYNLEQTYLANGAVANIPVTVSTGDNSYPGYPGSSPNVLAVGGTALHLTASGQYSFETGWGGPLTSGAGGGGQNAFASTPTYQSSNGVTLKSGKRADPDVALVADPFTGVSVYDSLDAASNGGNPWEEVGGTSLASPVFAGMIALAQQDRVAASKPLLNTAQIHNAIYGLYNSPAYNTYFHDVTLGTNLDFANQSIVGPGFKAVTGYDQATGLGSPIGRTLVPYLASL